MYIQYMPCFIPDLTCGYKVLVIGLGQGLKCLKFIPSNGSHCGGLNGSKKTTKQRDEVYRWGFFIQPPGSRNEDRYALLFQHACYKKVHL